MDTGLTSSHAIVPVIMASSKLAPSSQKRDFLENVAPPFKPSLFLNQAAVSVTMFIGQSHEQYVPATDQDIKYSYYYGTGNRGLKWPLSGKY